MKFIRGSLTEAAAKIVALGLVISHLDYANAVYSGLPSSEISKLHRVQNMAVKLVTRAKCYARSTDALNSLHWLPIHLRIRYKVPTLVLRALRGLALSYLGELIKPQAMSMFTDSGKHSYCPTHQV